jgi:ABC transporter DrrB family efflux protein
VTTISAAARSTRLAPSTLVIGKRSLLKYVRTPQLLIIGSVQAAMFLLIFRYVFGGAIGVAGVDYVHFLVPGFVTAGVLFSGMTAAVGMAEDLEQGLVDRLKSLPIPRAAVLLGRAASDTGALTWSLIITAAVGFAVGFRIQSTVVAALAALALLVLFGFAFEWVFLTLGMMAGNAQAANGMALMVFPLTFVSSAYVPVETMPGWMQAFAEHQPVTVMIDAVRVLTLGEGMFPESTSWYVVRAVLWTAALVAVFAPLAVWRYRRS